MRTYPNTRCKCSVVHVLNCMLELEELANSNYRHEQSSRSVQEVLCILYYTVAHSTQIASVLLDIRNNFGYPERGSLEASGT